MRRPPLVLLALFLLITFATSAQTTKLTDLPAGQIQPAGWVKEFLSRQESGLTGHPEESGFPFNTGMWTEELDYRDRQFKGGSGWWPYEQTAYYLDGALRCAYLNDSDSLKRRVTENINFVLSRADEEGILHAGNVADDWWPLVVFMRMLFEQYENTKDPALLRAIERHYRATYSKEESFFVPASGGFAVRSVLHVEHLANLYALTGNRWYLDTAEKLYEKFESTLAESGSGAATLTARAMARGTAPAGHAVTYHEFLKLPAILYYYTDKEQYRKALIGAYQQLEKYHELADGLASGVEELHGNRTDSAHEVCNVTDFNWTSGWALLATGAPFFADKMEKAIYNAGFSSITADFRAHQYYSAPNLPVATDMSSAYNDRTNWGFNAKGRLCYRPGHDTECCTGNVHRMLPTFLNRAVLQQPRGAKVVFYLPGTYTVAAGNRSLRLTQTTNYPFEHTVRLVIDEVPRDTTRLDLRIPGWADSYVISLNGQEIQSGDLSGFFATIIRRFKADDKIDISFSTKPRVDRRHGLAINYGPLVFSLPIPARRTLTTVDSGGKSSPEFPAYQLFPRDHRNWAFALPDDLTSEDIEVIRTPASGYPWDYGNSPLKLTVTGYPVANWKLRDNVGIAEIPADPKLQDGGERTLVLEPLGGTLLRITEFPGVSVRR